MELKMIKLAISKLDDQITLVLEENKQLKDEIKELREVIKNFNHSKQIEETTLLDSKTVCKRLGVSYNTLKLIIEEGLLNPIRINQRKIRFTKKGIEEYIKKMQQKSFSFIKYNLKTS